MYPEPKDTSKSEHFPGVKYPAEFFSDVGGVFQVCAREVIWSSEAKIAFWIYFVEQQPNGTFFEELQLILGSIRLDAEKEGTVCL